jgi:hypothetical protein
VEVYDGNLNGETEPLSLENTFDGTKMLELPRWSDPVTPLDLPLK